MKKLLVAPQNMKLAYEHVTINYLESINILNVLVLCQEKLSIYIVIWICIYFYFLFYFIYIYIYIYVYVKCIKKLKQHLAEDVYKSFYHVILLEVCKSYQIVPDGLYVEKEPCIGNPSKKSLDARKN